MTWQEKYVSDKGADKIPQEQLNEERDRQSTWKGIQSNDSKDDMKSRKKNGGTDQEDTRNC